MNIDYQKMSDRQLYAEHRRLVGEGGDYHGVDLELQRRSHKQMIDDARKERKRTLKYGGTVSYRLDTLISDGWSLATIQRVYRRT